MLGGGNVILCNGHFCSRDGFNELFDQLHKYNVPLFIFSAGVGDILEEIIRQANVFYSNVNVVSNYMDFDDNVSVCIANVWGAGREESCSAGIEGCKTLNRDTVRLKAAY